MTGEHQYQTNLCWSCNSSMLHFQTYHVGKMHGLGRDVWPLHSSVSLMETGTAFNMEETAACFMSMILWISTVCGNCVQSYIWNVTSWWFHYNRLKYAVVHFKDNLFKLILSQQCLTQHKISTSLFLTIYARIHIEVIFHTFDIERSTNYILYGEVITFLLANNKYRYQIPEQQH